MGRFTWLSMSARSSLSYFCSQKHRCFSWNSLCHVQVLTSRFQTALGSGQKIWERKTCKFTMSSMILQILVFLPVCLLSVTFQNSPIATLCIASCVWLCSVVETGWNLLPPSHPGPEFSWDLLDHLLGCVLGFHIRNGVVRSCSLAIVYSKI